MNTKTNPEFYSLERQKKDKESFWVYFVTRRISFLITPLFLRLGVSANQASIFGIIVGIAAAGLVMTGSFWNVFFGAMLMQFWLVLDSVDGNIARLKKTSTLFGKFLEEINGETMSALFFTSIGIAASKMPGILPSLVAINPLWFMFLGIITSFSVIFRHAISAHYLRIFSPEKEFKAESLLPSGILTFLYNSVIKVLGVYSLAQPLFILAILFNVLGLYSILYFLMNSVALFANIAGLIAKTKNR